MSANAWKPSNRNEGIGELLLRIVQFEEREGVALAAQLGCSVPSLPWMEDARATLERLGYIDSSGTTLADLCDEEGCERHFGYDGDALR